MTDCPGQLKRLSSLNLTPAVVSTPSHRPIPHAMASAPHLSHPPAVQTAQAGQAFFMGGYCSSGCAGALPLGRHELKTNTSLKSSYFFQSLSVSLLHAMEEKGGQCGGRGGAGGRCAARSTFSHASRLAVPHHPTLPHEPRPRRLADPPTRCSTPPIPAEPAQELSPTSVITFSFEEEIEIEEEIARGDMPCATD